MPKHEASAHHKPSYKIGGKTVSIAKLEHELGKILALREAGATQEEAAAASGVTRSFVSNIETLGSLGKGSQVAIFAFPVSNAAEIKAVAQKWGIETVIALSEDERSSSLLSGAEAFNQMLETIADLSAYDALILAASDYRIKTFKQILNIDLLDIELGKSPLQADVELDITQLEAKLASLIGKA